METKFTTKSVPDGAVAILTSIEGKLDESFEIPSEHSGLPVTTVDLRWFPNPYVKNLLYLQAYDIYQTLHLTRFPI